MRLQWDERGRGLVGGDLVSDSTVQLSTPLYLHTNQFLLFFREVPLHERYHHSPLPTHTRGTMDQRQRNTAGGVEPESKASHEVTSKSFYAAEMITMSSPRLSLLGECLSADVSMS